jgi:hypothetical protein
MKTKMKRQTNTLKAILLVLGSLAFLPQMHAVTPPPDGCYPNFTTPEGCNALQGLTSGAGNTGVGWRALFGTSTGSFTTGIGAGALVLNNSDSNTAVGASAQQNNSNGSNNTAVGRTALQNSTGDFNTATGAGADKRPIPVVSLRVDVKDYGAIGDGIIDDTDAINAAIDDANTRSGVVFVSRGTYMTNRNGLHPLGNRVRLVGDNKHNCILKLSEHPVNDFVRGRGDGWEIHNLTVDANGQFPPVNACAVAVHGNDWTISNCNIIVAKIGIGGGGNSDHWSIINNTILKPDPSGSYPNSLINMTHAPSLKPANHGLIHGNTCIGAGMGGFLINSEISNNTCSGCRYGAHIFTGFYPNSYHNIITNNTCHSGRGKNTVDGTVTCGLEIWGPDSRIENNTSYDNDGPGIVFGGQRTMVRYNISYNNGHGRFPGWNNGIGVRWANANQNANGSTVASNHSWDTRWPNEANMTQEWGMQIQPQVANLTITGNNFACNKLGALHQLNSKSSKRGSRN